jgi:digeranylgeranylglycerophospholipid reductase
MQTPKRYDVAIVGAGPAGARTAEALANQGLTVALIERDPVPGSPVHCTGIVSTECFERYDLPDSLVISSISSFMLRSPSGQSATVRRKTTQAHVLDRVALDRLLVARAVSAGADLLTSTTVSDLRWTGAGVEIDAEHGGVPFGINSTAAVVATGFGGKLPKRAGLGSPQDLLSGCQAVVESDKLDELEVFTGTAYGDGGFGWLVPWQPGYALAGLMTRRDTMNLLSDHIKRLQQAGRVGRVHEVYRCRAIPLGTATHSIVDGIVGVGDVVGQVKPTSGGGIYFGLLSADIAAAVVGDAIRSGDVSAASLMPYERQWRVLLESEIQQGYALRKLIERLPDAVIEHMHRLLNVPVLRRVLVAAAPSFDWHSGPLTRVLARLQHQTDTVSASAP